MSLYNEASLVMVPSGYKDGKLYSIKPTDGDGDFTFTRGSNLAATRVNSEGLIEKGRENLLVQSNTFDTTWSLGSGTVTGGQTGYDGSSDAWLFNYVSGANIVNQVNTQSGVQTYSVHAKGSVNNGLRLYAFGSTNCYAFFDLNLGTVEANLNLIDATIEDKGNGWYRCAITFDQTNTQLYMYLSNNQNSNASSGSILIQDAQLEQGLVATDYIETTTTTAQAGILEDMPRLDYSGGSCPSLLLEPQRTNLVPSSEYFGSGSGWTNQNIDYPLTNVSTSVDGLNNASLLSGGTTSGVAFRYIFRQITSNTTNTFSFFAKKKTGSGNIWLLGKNSGSFAYYNLTNGTADSATSGMTIDIKDYGDGWYRCYFTQDYTSAFDYTIGIGVCVVSGTPNYDASINPLQEIYIYGAQFEEGSYPTSYIPTYGSSVTRSQDLTTADTSSFYTDSSEGTLFTELSFPLAADGNYNGWFFWDGSNYNRIVLQRRGDTGRGQIEVRINNTTQASVISSSVITLEDNHKMLVKWDGNVFTLFIDGVNVGSDTSTDTYSGTDLNELASRPTYNAANIKQAIIFPTALTSNDCEVLTGTNYTSFASMASTLNYTQYE